MDWDTVINGMAAARSVKNVGAQATSEESANSGGPDFLAAAVFNSKQWAWEVGYDHAILLARGQ